MSIWSPVMVASRSQGIPVGPSGPATPELMDGATWAGRGDDVTYAPFDPPRLNRWNNRVPAGTAVIEQTTGGFHPTQITNNFGGVPAVVEGCYAISDQFDAPFVSAFVANNQWHIFALMKFGSMTYNASLTGSGFLFAATSTLYTGGFSTAFHLSVRSTAIGDPIVRGTFVNSIGTTFVVDTPYVNNAPTLVEFSGDGSTMSLRTNDSAAATQAYSGTMQNYAIHKVRVGSVNAEGNWDFSNNELFELAVANQKNADVANIRSYFAARYNVAV